MPQFFGKYRGTVLDNADPMQMARIQASVPAVTGGDALGWALPCAPFAGPDMGLVTVPPVGANVWIEFEAGDVNFPIWSGCFWGAGELPSEAMTSSPDEVQVLKAPGFRFVADRTKNSFGIDVEPPMVDTPASLSFAKGVIELRIANSVLTLSPDAIVMQKGTPSIAISDDAIHLVYDSASIGITPDEINLENASSSIEMSPATVDINKGALEIT
jgi:hypothetical protein